MKNLILPFSLGMALAASASAQVTINEIRIDQPGSDNDEFFELAGPAGTSLDGMFYFVVGDSSAGGLGGGLDGTPGFVDLTGSSIGANGLFLVGESSMTIGTPDLIADLAFENSDNVTHMLVMDFTGTNADDFDADDDGIFDYTPWTSIVDSVSLVENLASGELVYSANQVGPDGSFVPGHVLLYGGVWVIGSFGIGYGDTPGSANVIETGSSFCDPASTTSTGGDVYLTGYMGTGVGSGLHIEANGGPDMEVGYFLVGTDFADPGIVISNGSLCLAGQFYRYNVTGGSANSIGIFDASGQLLNLPGTATSGTGYDVPSDIPDSVPIPIMAGDTYHFQLWFRDTPAGVGSSNFSTGLTVMF
jgi:hypothetical protein